MKRLERLVTELLGQLDNQSGVWYCNAYNPITGLEEEIEVSAELSEILDKLREEVSE